MPLLFCGENTIYFDYNEKSGAECDVLCRTSAIYAFLREGFCQIHGEHGAVSGGETGTSWMGTDVL